jgi:hypothetical protein
MLGFACAMAQGHEEPTQESTLMRAHALVNADSWLAPDVTPSPNPPSPGISRR